MCAMAKRVRALLGSWVEARTGVIGMPLASVKVKVTTICPSLPMVTPVIVLTSPAPAGCGVGIGVTTEQPLKELLTASTILVTEIRPVWSGSPAGQAEIGVVP